MKTLVELPEVLTPGMQIKSKHGTRAMVSVCRDRNRAGQLLYKLRYIHGKHLVASSTQWTHQQLVSAGCRLKLNNADAMMYALTH